jgi:hypothetical protein
MHVLTRRNFVAGVAVSSSVIAGITVTKMAAAAQIGDDARLIDLCSRYRELNPVIEAAGRRHEEAFYGLVAEIGECPVASSQENRRWFDLYRQSEAWVLEDEVDALCDRQCAIMDEIERMPSASTAGIVAKLELWQVTHEHYADDNDMLVMSAIDDLKALS